MASEKNRFHDMNDIGPLRSFRKYQNKSVPKRVDNSNFQMKRRRGNFMNDDAGRWENLQWLAATVEEVFERVCSRSASYPIVMMGFYSFQRVREESRQHELQMALL